MDQQNNDQQTQEIPEEQVSQSDIDEYNNYIKGFEEQNEEEYSEKDIMNLTEEDAKNVEMALKLDQTDDESTQDESQQNVEQQNNNSATSQKLSQLIKQYEDQLVGEKKWQYRGETYSEEREKNALIGELPNMELKLKSRQKLILTEQLNQELEKVVIERIKNNNFDDVKYSAEQVEKEDEIKDISTNKVEVGLSDQINKIGLRTEVPQLILNKRKELEEQFKDIQTEIRSYFKYM